MTRYRTLKVDDLEIFYREAGPPDAPACCSCTASRPRHACTNRSSGAWPTGDD